MTLLNHPNHFTKMYRRSIVPSLCLLVLIGLSASSLAAQAPTYAELFEREIGDRITLNSEAVRYAEAVAEASDRVALEEIGESYEGRRSVVAVVTVPENHARLDEIRENSVRLGDPRVLSGGEANRVIVDQPSVFYFGGSIHGFELSGSEAALMLLERLATEDDPETMEVLRGSVVLIDAVMNPDGRDAFAHHNHRRVGHTPNPSWDDWSNDFTGWEGLGFRTSSYHFDMNRDWFAHTHPEIRGRAALFQRWRPQAAVDAHEMGSDVEFYIDPPADPVNPFFPDHSSRWFGRFGQAHAQAFDEAGIEYMTEERFNFFYPGYTTSWSNYQGAVGMLYEQGSSRGLAAERPDGSVRTLADAAWQQYTAGWAALRLAATEGQALLRDFHQSHEEAVADGRQGTRRYLISADGGDPGHIAEVVNLLIRNGVEVAQLTEPARLRGASDRTGASAGTLDVPAGSYVVEAAQPRNRLIRVLFEPHIDAPEAFLEEARTRVDRAENPRFYDITAWSLPLLYNLQVYGSTDGRGLSVQQVTSEVSGPRSLPSRRAGYAYLFDGRQAGSLSALYHLLDRGHRAAMTLKPTSVEGERLSSGSVVVRVGQNDEAVHDAVFELAERFGLDLRGVDTGLGDPGEFALGSGDVIPVRKPTIALLGEHPVNGYSFGWAWHALDRQYEIPTTVLRAGSVANRRLDRYDVLVIPEVSSAALAAELGEEGQERIARWVRDGGTLVTIGAAGEFARGALDLIRLRSWYDDEEHEDALQVSVPGAFLRVELDPETWLRAGYDQATVPMLVNSNRVYTAPDGPPSAARRVVGRYANPEPHVAGHMWEESAERLPGAVFAYEERVGQGRVISFAEDLNFRGYWRGADRLFLNAVVVGPSAR